MNEDWFYGSNINNVQKMFDVFDEIKRGKTIDEVREYGYYLVFNIYNGEIYGVPKLYKDVYNLKTVGALLFGPYLPRYNMEGKYIGYTIGNETKIRKTNIKLKIRKFIQYDLTYYADILFSITAIIFLIILLINLIISWGYW